jgi:hypothetical protein
MLEGEKPADMNLAAAKALGLPAPPSWLTRADEIRPTCRRGFRDLPSALLGWAGKPKGLLKNNLVTFLGASCSELWCSSIPHESHEETC